MFRVKGLAQVPRIGCAGNFNSLPSDQQLRALNAEPPLLKHSTHNSASVWIVKNPLPLIDQSSFKANI